MENKTVEMVVKDLLLADNQKKKEDLFIWTPCRTQIMLEIYGGFSAHAGQNMRGTFPRGYMLRIFCIVCEMISQAH